MVSAEVCEIYWYIATKNYFSLCIGGFLRNLELFVTFHLGFVYEILKMITSKLIGTGFMCRKRHIKHGIASPVIIGDY